ncbi:PLP-dependent aminotransferase family protein [bacterium]|nr:PLP-dependent aminotransferase family protein [bacterium]
MAIASLDRSRNISLIRQLFEQLQTKILDGVLSEGYRLPSTRLMAEELGVSRNVVLEAYDQLLAEGYVESRSGSGTFVAEGAIYLNKEAPVLEPIGHVGFKPLNPKGVDFRSGLPDLRLFPINLWLRLTREVYQEVTPAQLAYGSPEGRMELREAIANYVRIHRGVKCHPEQILITGGTTQAIGLISRLLLHEDNKCAVLEDPITFDIQQIIEGFGGIIHPVPIDDQGLVTARLPENLKPRFIYVTPSHQFPLGVTMPIQRRIQLLEYARKTDSYILEDDYDSEFRYDAMPVNSIQGIDPGRVVYVGTFSKTLCPSLRIGYIIFPTELIEKGRMLKWFTDLHNATMDQLVLARFLKQGHFNRYVMRMKKVQKQKRVFIENKLKEVFKDNVVLLGSATGLHLAVTFPGVRFTPDLLKTIEKSGVKIYPVEEHTINKGVYQDTIILGYGLLDNAQIEQGLHGLAKVITTVMDQC